MKACDASTEEWRQNTVPPNSVSGAARAPEGKLSLVCPDSRSGEFQDQRNWVFSTGPQEMLSCPCEELSRIKCTAPGLNSAADHQAPLGVHVAVLQSSHKPCSL